METHKDIMMKFIFDNTDNKLVFVGSIIPSSYDNDKYTVASIKSGEIFDPKYTYILVDNEALKGGLIATDDAIEQQIKKELLATQYQKDRAKAYPSVEEQLDILYHGGYDIWKATIQLVKDSNPKPN